MGIRVPCHPLIEFCSFREHFEWLLDCGLSQLVLGCRGITREQIPDRPNRVARSFSYFFREGPEAECLPLVFRERLSQPGARSVELAEWVAYSAGRAILVSGETGAGKTTAQLKLIFEALRAQLGSFDGGSDQCYPTRLQGFVGCYLRLDHQPSHWAGGKFQCVLKYETPEGERELVTDAGGEVRFDLYPPTIFLVDLNQIGIIARSRREASRGMQKGEDRAAHWTDVVRFLFRVAQIQKQHRFVLTYRSQSLWSEEDALLPQICSQYNVRWLTAERLTREQVAPAALSDGYADLYTLPLFYYFARSLCDVNPPSVEADIGQLYERITELWLVKQQQLPDDEQALIRDLMVRFALWMFEKSQFGVSADDLRGLVAEPEEYFSGMGDGGSLHGRWTRDVFRSNEQLCRRHSLERLPADTANKVMESSLLRPIGGGRWGFVHDSFRDYLAAIGLYRLRWGWEGKRTLYPQVISLRKWATACAETLVNLAATQNGVLRFLRSSLCPKHRNVLLHELLNSSSKNASWVAAYLAASPQVPATLIRRTVRRVVRSVKYPGHVSWQLEAVANLGANALGPLEEIAKERQVAYYRAFCKAAIDEISVPEDNLLRSHVGFASRTQAPEPIRNFDRLVAAAIRGRSRPRTILKDNVTANPDKLVPLVLAAIRDSPEPDRWLLAECLTGCRLLADNYDLAPVWSSVDQALPSCVSEWKVGLVKRILLIAPREQHAINVASRLTRRLLAGQDNRSLESCLAAWQSALPETEPILEAVYRELLSEPLAERVPMPMRRVCAHLVIRRRLDRIESQALLVHFMKTRRKEGPIASFAPSYVLESSVTPEVLREVISILESEELWRHTAQAQMWLERLRTLEADAVSGAASTRRSSEQRALKLHDLASTDCIHLLGMVDDEFLSDALRVLRSLSTMTFPISVRRPAADGLCQLYSRTPDELAPELIRLLEDPDSGVRRVVRKTLEEQGGHGILPRLAERRKGNADMWAVAYALAGRVSSTRHDDVELS